jgi:hypothetical protein
VREGEGDGVVVKDLLIVKGFCCHIPASFCLLV